MNNLITRTITGFFFVASIIATMIWHPLAFGVMFYIVMLLGLNELLRMSVGQSLSVHRGALYFIISLAYLIPMAVAHNLLAAYWLVAIVPLFMTFFILELFRKTPDPLGNISWSILAVIYLAIPFASLNFFYNPDFQGTDSRFYILLGYFLLLWAHDIFAYLTGLFFGRHKLFERISPKKTWEGSIGGLVFSLLMAWGLAYFMHDLTLLEWMGMALVIAVFGTFGDLSESMLKRKYQVKDSGTILPGHGGILDRFDAMMFSAPAVLCYLVIISL